MSYIPNARKGENGYKDTDLTGSRAEYLRGYDKAIEDLLTLENNLEMYAGDSLFFHYLMDNPEKAEEFFECVKDYAEMQRNETAVSLLDDQYAEEEDNEDE